MSIWKTKPVTEAKPWGSVVNIWTPFGMKGKIIYVEKGKRNSLKYYMNRNQCLYCLKGSVIVSAPEEFEFGDIIYKDEGAVFELNPGDVILIQSENPYRLKALEDSILVEVLLGKDNQPIVMLDDDYGRVNKQNQTEI